MPTQILNGFNGTGPGTKVCTMTGGTLGHDALKLGPDGDKWSVYGLDELETFLSHCGTTKFRHIAKAGIDHLCCQYGGWAFQVFASSRPHSVSFLHVKVPKKLVMDDGPGVYWFSANDLRIGFQKAKDGSRAPRIWRRIDRDMEEIAINFCVKKNGG